MLKAKPYAVLDFETEEIEDRPKYPPMPVGVAIKTEGESRYLAWGHPSGNNISFTDAKRIYKSVYKSHTCVFHNSAFDMAVSTEHMGLKRLDAPDFEDTLFLTYLYDPRDNSLELKSWCEKHLGIPPFEQMELKDWILNNIKGSRSSNWGQFISKAPGDLVGRYAIGDVDRTLEVFTHTMDYITRADMLSAYEREKKVMPIFDDMSNGGLNIDVKKLERDKEKWQKELIILENKAKKILRPSRVGFRASLDVEDFDITSGKQLADALDRAGKVTDWVYTEPSKTFPQGQRSTKREVLLKICNDKNLTHTLARHGILSTYINTFMGPWLEKASSADGKIYPSFNQVRSVDDRGKSSGTRTGRPSSTNPNLFNVPKNPEDEDKPWTKGLPSMRDYIIPDKGTVFCNRDYNQQELRILGHFEDGELQEQYKINPLLDTHDHVKELVADRTGKDYKRKFIKTVNFGAIYGMGAPSTSEKLDISYDEAKTLLNDHGRALPGLRKLKREIVNLAKRDIPIKTWGGRLYYVEEPKLINGRKRTYEYKQLNYLIQGSAADCTKEAMIRVAEACSHSRLVLQVYDELMICAERPRYKQEMKLMKEAMESIEFDVKMLSNGSVGFKSWGEAEDYIDP